MNTINAISIQQQPAPDHAVGRSGAIICTPMQVSMTEDNTKISGVGRLQDGFSMVLAWQIKPDGERRMHVSAGYPGSNHEEDGDERFKRFRALVSDVEDESQGRVDVLIERFVKEFLGSEAKAVLTTVGSRVSLLIPADSLLITAISSALSELIPLDTAKPASRTLH